MPDWDVSLVTDMSELFNSKASSTRTFGEHLTALVSMFTDMSKLSARYLRWRFVVFYGATAFNQPIGSWDTSQRA